MLEAARLRLSHFGGRFTLLNHDLRDSQQPVVDAGTFDAAVGIQAVHHLNAEDKRALFQWVSLALRDGGLFLMAARVQLTSAALFPYHLRLWDRLQKLSGTETSSEGYSYVDHLARCALRGDAPDTVEDQLRWLRAAGFGEVDEFYRHIERAVFGGLKMPRQPAMAAPEPQARYAELRGV
jgi:tRNA (cmo5U34)-methyltransferase